jgi:hypothetical protein
MAACALNTSATEEEIACMNSKPPPNWGRTARFTDNAANSGRQAPAQQLARVRCTPPTDFAIYLAATKALNPTGLITRIPEHFAVQFGTGGAAFGTLDLRSTVRGTVLHVTAEQVEIVCNHIVAASPGVYEAQASVAMGSPTEAWVSSSRVTSNPIDATPGVEIPLWATHAQISGDVFHIGSTAFIQQCRENGNVLWTGPVTDYIDRPVPLAEDATSLQGWDSIGGAAPTITPSNIRFRVFF